VRLSVDITGAQADGRSSQPAVSADGEIVAFESGASNLVEGDTNGVSDVFVRDLLVNSLERVSVSSSGAQQNRSVIPPFTMAPDVTRDGRYVVFESDATNLVRTDRNGKTDVFLRDRRHKTTALVSTDSEYTQGNNDSFAPTIAPNGDVVAFESFASNLTPGQDGPREDIFVRDLRHGGTTVASVTSDGAPRAAELVTQLLQRPSLSDDGALVAFGSTSPNLVPGDGNGVEDIFLRRMDPPRARLVRKTGQSRPLVQIATDDPRAVSHLCRLDGGDPFRCTSRIRLPRLARGAHTLEVRAGGPGMLFDDTPLKVRLKVRRGGDRSDPRVRIARPSGARLRIVRGTARDVGTGVARVEVAVTYFGRVSPSKFGCLAFTSDGFRPRRCARRIYRPAQGARSWKLRLPRSIRGPVAIYARAYDRAGNRSRVAILRTTVK
jgi:hypothetical protein